MAQYYSLENVEELAGGDESFVTILVQTFLEEIPNDLESMKSSVQSGDAAMAYQYAHKMKPSFQLFNVEVLTYIKILESWTQDAIGQEEATFALNTILHKSSAAIEEMKKDF